MKLLFVIEELNDGGITTVLVNRLNYLARNTEFKIILLTEFQSEKSIKEKFIPEVNIISLDFNQLRSKKTRLKTISYFRVLKQAKAKLQYEIDNLNPDVITSFDIGFSRVLMPKIKTKGIKIIEFHNSYYGIQKREEYYIKGVTKKIKQKIRFPLSREKSHNFYDYAVTLTKEDLLDRKYLKIKKTQIYNPLPILADHPISFKQRKNIILGIGRIAYQKNFGQVIEAVNLIKNQLNSWEIHLYGKGDEINKLKKKISEKNLNELIFLKGYSNNINLVYQNAKLLVSTSRFEGHPMNILEAFCFNLPVISYNCKCGPRETIRHGINGYLIEPSPQKLAEKILKLIKDSQKLEEFSNNTKIDFGKFNQEKIMNQWQDFYCSLKNK